MNKEEAIQAMKEGKKVTHCFFFYGEWMTIEDNEILFEGILRISIEEFFRFRKHRFWETGYELYK